MTPVWNAIILFYLVKVPVLHRYNISIGHICVICTYNLHCCRDVTVGVTGATVVAPMSTMGGRGGGRFCLTSQRSNQKFPRGYISRPLFYVNINISINDFFTLTTRTRKYFKNKAQIGFVWQSLILTRFKALFCHFEPFFKKWQARFKSGSNS